MRRLVALLVTVSLGCSDSRNLPSSPGIEAIDAPASSLTLGWSIVAATNFGPRFLPGAATGSDGRIYVFGGQYQPVNGAKATAEVYSPSLNAWSLIAPMPVARTNQASALGSDGRIYNIGGFLSPTPPGVVITASVDVYDPATDTWASGPVLPDGPRQNLSGTAGLDGRIYVAGGNLVSGSVRTATAFVLDVASGVWTPIAPMLHNRTSFAMATGLSGRIYAIGGSSTVGAGTVTLSDVDAYDPATDTWTAVASLPVELSFHAAARGADGRIYVFGGTNPAFVTTGYAYDEAANSWSTIPGLNVPRRGGRGVLAGDGRVYNVGGSSLSGANEPAEALGPICSQAPAIALTVSPTELWPPNHEMVTVARGIAASDDCGAPGLLVSVSSNESPNGSGDGNTASDWSIIAHPDGSFDVAVRSERAGGGSGRVYTITATASDSDGNVTVATGTVTVPKSKKK